jgi:hypothetical protein
MCPSVYKFNDLCGTMQRTEMHICCFLLRMILLVVTAQLVSQYYSGFSVALSSLITIEFCSVSKQ